MRRLTLTLSLLLLSPLALAQPGPGMGRGPGGGMGRGMGPGAGMGHGPGMGMGMGMGMGRGRCAMVLVHAPADVLKSRFKLDDGQVAKLETLRTSFLNKQITLRAELQKLQVKHRPLFEADLPAEAQVLNAMRAMRSLHGKLQEETFKTHLKLLSVLTKEQRAQIRTDCPWGRGGKGWGGKGWGGKGGPGRGRGQGPGWGPGR